MIRRPPSPPLFPSTPLSRSSLAITAEYPARGERTQLFPRHAKDPYTELNLPEPDYTGQSVPVLMRRRDKSLQTHEVHSDRKSTRLNSSHLVISYAVFCLKKK